MTREDERKLHEAYSVLDKLINTPQSQLKLKEIEDILYEFKDVVNLMLREVPLKPVYLCKVTAFLDKYCDSFIKKYQKKKMRNKDKENK